MREAVRYVPPVAERADRVHHVADMLPGEAQRACPEDLVEDLDALATDQMHREGAAQDDVGARGDAQVHELARLDGGRCSRRVQCDQTHALGDTIVGDDADDLDGRLVVGRTHTSSASGSSAAGGESKSWSA